MEENAGEDFDLKSGTLVRNIGKCNRTFWCLQQNVLAG